MYDSRSNHARGGVHLERAWRKEDGRRLPTRPRPQSDTEIVEGVLAYLERDMTAKVEVSQREIERAHAEALIEHYDRLEEEARLWLDEDYDDVPFWERDEVYFEGVDTPNMNTRDDCWLPLLTVEEAREHFGRDWEHNGFHILHHR